MERRHGRPRTDAERAARHHGISLEEAGRRLAASEITLPPRGTGVRALEERERKRREAGTALAVVGLVLAAVGMAVALSKPREG